MCELQNLCIYLSDGGECPDHLLPGELMAAGGEDQAVGDHLQVPARGHQRHVLQHTQGRRLLTRTRVSVSGFCVEEAFDTCTQLREHGLKTSAGDIRGGEQGGDAGHGGHTDLLVTGVPQARGHEVSDDVTRVTHDILGVTVVQTREAGHCCQPDCPGIFAKL